MKLWIFGQSMSLPHLVDEHKFWGYLLAEGLSISYENFAQSGADNFFIYHTFLENSHLIADDDIVVIGWSHYSRKSFEYQPDNPQHIDVIDRSLKFTTKTRQLFRSYNPTASTFNKWKRLTPLNSGLEFYDTWFSNYYSEYEQRCNLTSYLDSVTLRCPCKYIPFYFSKESVNHLDLQTENFMLEFIHDNKCEINKNDIHLNESGHQLWADHLRTLL